MLIIDTNSVFRSSTLVPAAELKSPGWREISLIVS